MAAYLVRRVVYMVVILLLVSFLAFTIVQLQPGGSCEREGEAGVGLQYAQWLLGVLQGSLGTSCSAAGTPVTTSLFGGGAWLRTLILLTAALLLSLGIGVLLGLYAALKRNKLGDHLVRSLSALNLAFPPFLIALFLILLLYLVNSGERWNLDPSGKAFSSQLTLATGGERFYYWMIYLLPPLMVVLVAQWPVITRHMRAYLLDVFHQPYIQVARAKGLAERQINKHALHNALHPLIGLMGFWLPSLFESTLAVAIVMNYSTVELNLWDAILHQDQYVIAGGIVFFGGILMVGNLLADLALAWADPRIRYE